MILDMHSHWGTRRGYPFQTPEELAQQERVFKSTPRYVSEAEMAEHFRKTGVRVMLDLGVMEPSGNVRIVGRLKEMINRGGKKFFPREVEEILYTHPSVLHAAIVGVPDPRLGERNCLCVIPRPGTSVRLEEMVAFLRDGVATYKLPEELEIFDEFPFTPTGKIQRHALTRQVLARRGSA